MIQLLPMEEAQVEDLLRDWDGSIGQWCSNAAEVRSFLAPALQQGLEFHRRVGTRPPWHAYLGVERETQRVVGVCSFKGNPGAAGEVEIAYGTVPGLEGRGYATAMAVALVEIALGSPAVRRVIAHTLPQVNASTRVLQKAGMTQVGEVMDPEDGKVWRWEKGRREAPEL